MNTANINSKISPLPHLFLQALIAYVHTDRSALYNKYIVSIMPYPKPVKIQKSDFQRHKNINKSKAKQNKKTKVKAS